MVQANKTVLGSAVNCAVLALLDAGVAMGDDDDRVLAGSDAEEGLFIHL